MTRQVRCECGYTARGNTDDAVIALILAHLETDHPDLVSGTGRNDLAFMAAGRGD